MRFRACRTKDFFPQKRPFRKWLQSGKRKSAAAIKRKRMTPLLNKKWPIKKKIAIQQVTKMARKAIKPGPRLSFASTIDKKASGCSSLRS